MERNSGTKSINVVQHEKLKELHAELERIDSYIKSDEKILVDDGAIISNLGWISILSTTIGGLAMASFGLGL